MRMIKKYAELSTQTKNQLNTYINTEFGHIPIVKEIEWEAPNWTIIKYEKNEIVSFYNIVEREILINNVKYKAGGLNNVITPKMFRGKGLASKMLSETESFMFQELNCELGLLLCADDLIPFYEKLGWYKVDCPVYFSQLSGQKLWGANAMLLSKKERLTPKEIDLSGKPW